MPRVDAHALFDWLDHLKDKTYLYLTEPSLEYTQFFRYMELDDHLLRAAASLWDPTTHVFRFGGVEMSPLFEEFSSIMGISTNTNDAPLLPSPRPGYVHQLAQMLGLTIRNAGDFIIDKEIDVGRLASHYHHHTKMWCKGYKEALLICLACHFIFSSKSHAIIPLVPAMLERKNPMAICLAETLMGLDEAHAQGTTLLRGSPYVLQIWLWERIHIVEAPRSFHQHSYPHLRKIRFRPRTFERWQLWLCERSHAGVYWMIDRWTHDSVVVTLPKHIGITLLGLHTSTFSVPRRVAYQYGQDPDLEMMPRPHQKTSSVTLRKVDIYAKDWESRVMAPMVWGADVGPQ